jgi:hypothetical protein
MHDIVGRIGFLSKTEIIFGSAMKLWTGIVYLRGDSGKKFSPPFRWEMLNGHISAEKVPKPPVPRAGRSDYPKCIPNCVFRYDNIESPSKIGQLNRFGTFFAPNAPLQVHLPPKRGRKFSPNHPVNRRFLSTIS